MTGHASHQAYIRRQTASNFKNLENLIRGRHRLSNTTRSTLAASLGVQATDLDALEGSSLDGPLIPLILTVFGMIEGLPERVTSSMLAREVLCPCCGTNLMDDADAWWQSHTPELGGAESLFIDRMLNAIVGASLIESLIGDFQEHPDPGLESLDCLSNPNRHPIGNWLAEAQVALGCKSLPQLAAMIQLQGGRGSSFTHGRLKNWSAGMYVLPMDDGAAIAEAMGKPHSGWRRLIAARTFAMITDFLAAAMPDDRGRIAAQQIIDARLRHLAGKLRIATSAKPGQSHQSDPPESP